MSESETEPNTERTPLMDTSASIDSTTRIGFRQEDYDDLEGQQPRVSVSKPVSIDPTTRSCRQ